MSEFEKSSLLRGTEGSNPSPSSGESSANLTSSIRAPKSTIRRNATGSVRVGPKVSRRQSSIIPAGRIWSLDEEADVAELFRQRFRRVVPDTRLVGRLADPDGLFEAWADD
jgi:hypothetical protein